MSKAVVHAHGRHNSWPAFCGGAQEYSELLCVRDTFWQERLTQAIGLDREPTGLLHQALNEQTKPLRRYFSVRMLLCMAHELPEAPLLLLLCADACSCLRSFPGHRRCYPNSMPDVRHVHGLSFCRENRMCSLC